MTSGKSIAIALFLVLTLGTVGIAHGVLAGRWRSPDMDLLSLDMEKIPLKIGSWESDGSEKIPPDPRILDAVDSLKRRYVNPKDGNVVTVMLSRGRPGPMVIKHLPTECYIASGFEFESRPKKIHIDRRDSQGSDEFAVATFRKTNEAGPQKVCVHWSWTGDGVWQTPERPRMTFAPYSVLYKVYVIRSVHAEEQGSEESAVLDFTRDLTQAMRVSLFAKGST